MAVVQSPAVDPIKFISNSTRLTFKTNNVFTNSDLEKHNEKDLSIVENLLAADHSPLEQISYSVMIEGASRSFLAQVTRHRLASYVSASTHYSNWINADFVIPIEIYEKCEELQSTAPLKDFITAYESAHKSYLELQDKYELDHGVTRQLLPLGFRNNLLITTNIRNWFRILQLRLCGRNQSEIAYISWLISKELTKLCPEIFSMLGPSCKRFSRCSEGKLTCKRPWVNGNNPDEERWQNVKELGDKWCRRLSAESLINDN